MPVFAGAYVREPSDFYTVTTEAELIATADDPQAPVISESVLSWDDLEPAEEAALVATINAIVLRVEGITNGYVRSGGYVLPAIDQTVTDIVVQLSWNNLLFRKKALDLAEKRDADAPLYAQLRDIASGKLVLETEETTEESPASIVGGIGGAARTFSRETLEDM